MFQMRCQLLSADVIEMFFNLIFISQKLKEYNSI